MIGSLLQPAINAIQKQLSQAIRNSNYQRIARVHLARLFQLSKIDRKMTSSIEDGVDKAVEFISNIRIQISNRKKETKVIINFSTKISYEASNIRNSSVAQGKNITINNIKLHLFVKPEDLNHLKILLSKFSELEKKCTDTTDCHNHNTIKTEYRELDSKLIKKLSSITDYSQLQSALGTKDN